MGEKIAERNEKAFEYTTDSAVLGKGSGRTYWLTRWDQVGFKMIERRGCS